MKFYDRESEIDAIQKLHQQSLKTSTFTVLLGRRRVGKTALLMQALKGRNKMVYLFAKKTAEGVLCQDFQNSFNQQIEKYFIGRITNLKELFEGFFLYAENTPLTIIIDEFQDLDFVNSSFCSDLQYLWDMHKDKSHLNFIVCGSIYSMMVRIFGNYKAPLFGRATNRIDLRPFRTDTIKQILADYNPSYSPDDLLCLYSISGGIPYYIAILMDMGATTKDKMIDAVCQPQSRFLHEGFDMTVSEFGKQYSNYFGILQLIASGMTTQKEIDSIVGKNSGPYMQTLENEYSLISRNKPFNSKPGTRNMRWNLNDNFLTFWFRFIAPYSSLIEMGNFESLHKIIDEGYPQFSGKMLERYFRQKIMEETSATNVGSWWDRKGENEIDLIAVSSIDKWIKVAEVKRNRKKIDLTLTKKKVSAMRSTLPRYPLEVIGLSLEDM